MCGASASVDRTGVNFTRKGPDEAFCTSCGQVIKIMAEICPQCGVRQRGSNQESSSLPLLLNIIIGLVAFLGVGHFVTGRIGKGILFMASGLITTFIIMTTFWFGIGLLFIPVYLGLWIWSIVDINKKR
tara:strand:- start:60 stop:446 length:387 start_codon:yes stop_codon:yes gene_type:complete